MCKNSQNRQIKTENTFEIDWEIIIMDELEYLIDKLCDFIMTRHGCGECPLQGSPCEKYKIYEKELGYEYNEEE
jgi:hypothetical protein